MSTPLFQTNHSPLGAWASLTFGAAGKGIGIDDQRLATTSNADLLVTVTRDGTTTAFPFIENAGNYSSWRILSADAITRNLTPCVDEFSTGEAGITLRVFTPHAALPNPKRSGNLQYATVPGLFIEMIVDNSGSDSPATAFVGLNYRGEGSLRPVDWSSKTMCGIGRAGEWILAAAPVKDEIFTILSANLAEQIAGGTSAIDPTSSSGGIAIKVGPRMKRTVNLAFAFYHGGSATQSSVATSGRYLYTVYFPRVEAVANFLLQNHQKIRESCGSLDSRTTAACGDAEKLSLISRGIRAYEANTQLIDAEGVPYFAVISGGSEQEGGRGYRNALDQAVDHLPWELYRNPWVIRNIFDLGTTSYAYHDKVRFPMDAESPTDPAPLREGGMTFAHDFGYHGCYTPAGVSAYESANRTGAGSFMSTEVLLNGVYLLTSYALLADDTPWAKTRLPFARELLTNMENRDHWDPERRNGLLKAESEKVGTGAEVTAFVGAGEVLERAHGSLYLAVKTFCANLMLTTYFQNNNDLHTADYSYAFAQKTAQSLVATFNADAGILPANVLNPGATAERMIAALEPLAVPTYLGLTSTLAEYFPELFNVLKTHAMTCLKHAPEGCVDPATGALRLTSGSSRTIPAKVISVLYVLERLFGIDVQAVLPGAWKGVLESADATDGRLITAALYAKPVVVPQPQG
ncbi:MAG TPA: glycoside hydrolase family 52 protein [Phycisphaerae bacterium]|nr:glycoside hydrolase family 52 protein [Phycisphaerae bacterium]